MILDKIKNLVDKMFEGDKTPADKFGMSWEMLEGAEKETSKPDISEPVISFVKTVKKDPKRFIFKLDDERSGGSGGYSEVFFIMTDTVTCEEFLVIIEKFGGRGNTVTRFDYVTLVDLTKDEESYLTQELLLPYLERKEKYDEIIKERKEKYNEIIKERRNVQERRRLTKIYKGE